MLDGISITCFFASYLVAWLLEISRLRFKSGVRGALLVGFGAAGWVAHTLFLGVRAARATSAPLSSEFDWYLVAAWVLAAIYLYLTIYHPRTAMGLFVLPLVLALVLVARFLADETPYELDRAGKFWGLVHGISLLVGSVAVMIGFATGWMYLLAASRLKRKAAPARFLQLPSLEWLAHTNSQAIWISLPALGAGLASGLVLNTIHDSPQGALLPWHDPIIWSSGLFLTWIIAAGLFLAFYKPARQGRKVAYLTLASFVLRLGWLVLRWIAPSRHSSQPDSAGERAAWRATSEKSQAFDLALDASDRFSRRGGPA